MKGSVLQLAGPAYSLQEQPGVCRIARLPRTSNTNLLPEPIITDGYVRRLEAACQLMHEGLRSPQATGAQPASFSPSAHNVPPAASPTPSASGSIAAVEVCTLLLTDREVLDVVLALHDIRAAQLCHLTPWSGSHALQLPPPSEALAKQLSQSQWSVPGGQLLAFVKNLERESSLKGDPLLRVWDSMHRAMLLVLAALQSLPIRPHPQHPDPAATTHTSTTTQLPPGYHRCSACLLLSLRLAIYLARHCAEQAMDKDSALARLHGTLPGLLLGLSTSVTVMQAAGHPEAQAQHVQFVRCLLHLGPLVTLNMYDDSNCFGEDMLAWLQDDVTISCPDQLAGLLASSPAVTGWPGALPRKPSPMDSSTAEDSPGLGHKSGRCSRNRSRGNGRGRGKGSSTGRHEQGCSTAGPANLAAVNASAHLAQALCAVLGRQEEQLGITCQAEGPEAWSMFQEEASELPSSIMCALIREMYCADYIVGLLEAASAPSHPGAVTNLGPSPPSPSASSSSLLAVILSVLPRSLVVFQACAVALRLAVKISSFTCPGSFPVFIRDSYLPLCHALRLMMELWPDQRCQPAMLRLMVRSAAAGAHAYAILGLLLDGAPDHGSEPRSLSGSACTAELEQTLSTIVARVCQMWLLVLAPPGRSEQLSGTSYIRSNERCRIVEGNAFSGKEKVLHQPPSTQQLAPLALDLVWGMEGMLQGRQQAPSSMSPEAERLLACLTLVLTVALPLDTWLAAVAYNPAAGAKIIEQAIHDSLTKIEAEQVWGWQALAEGTPAEASLATPMQPGSHTVSSLRARAQHSPPAKCSKRTKAEQAAEHTQPTKGKDRGKGKAANAKPAQPEQGEQLPDNGEVYPELGYKRLQDRPPKVALAMTDAVLQFSGPAYTSQDQPGVCHIARLSCTSNMTLSPETMTTGDYVRRLEAACQLLHEGLRAPQATGAQTASSCTFTHKAALGSIVAVALRTLLLTDQETLDVVLALHDIRAAQLCHFMSWSGSHSLKLPPPSEALAKQLSHSQRSVPGSQLLSFVTALEGGNSLEGDPLLRVWDSMHRAMLLVLAALQSLPIHPHPQHPDPAATTHTSATTQLPLGYHRCSACLLLSLRLAIGLAQHCVDQPLDKDLALARLHGTLPGLLLGLSTAMAVMQAAGHPEAQAQRVQFVRCLLHLGSKLATSVKKTDPKASSNSSGRGHGSSRGQASSRGPCGDTGWSGAAQSAGDKLHALAVTSFVYLAQALCGVLGRQMEAFTYEELITTCQQEGPVSIEELNRDVINFGVTTLTIASQHSIDLEQPLKDAARATSRASARVAASRHSAAVVSTPPLVSNILSLLARFLPEFQAAVVAVKLAATLGAVNESTAICQKMPKLFLTSLSTTYVLLYPAIVRLMELMPDWRRRPAVLRTGLRVATAGALAHNTMVLLLHDAQLMNRTPHAYSKQRLPEMEEKLSDVFIHTIHLWSVVLEQDGVDKPPTGPFLLDDDFIYRLTIDTVAVLPSPSSTQLAPLALDLVLGMENTLQMVMRQQDMVWKCPFWNDGNLVQSLADGYRTLLALFGHVIEVLATPSVVGPAGLAAQPASWLPCGNSLVEGWCTRLVAGVCKLMTDIATPASTAVPILLKIMLNRRLRGSHKLLLRGQRQAPLSMSQEAERLLSCLTLVLTAMVPQDLCLAMAGGVTNTVPGLDLTLERERRAMGVALSKLQPEQVWTWQALAAGTPAEATLQGVLSALASLFQVQGLVTPRAPGWRHQRLTLAMGEWHKC
ncbi:hypothetical protein QJQ45_008521 [Haematococcus lacustris]|nr:hypothetical protein QJQ45_008521 [Haematococcus lacustris]